jgi:hypothetical protein
MKAKERLTLLFLTVCDGDSGAWVVHSHSPEVYGHVVATDVFGYAYVIPMLDTFKNIKECMGAADVGLPCNDNMSINGTDESSNHDEAENRAAIDLQNALETSHSLLTLEPVNGGTKVRSATTRPKSAIRPSAAGFESTVSLSTTSHDSSDNNPNPARQRLAKKRLNRSNMKRPLAKLSQIDKPRMSTPLMVKGSVSISASTKECETPSHAQECTCASTSRHLFAREWDPKFSRGGDVIDHWRDSFVQTQRDMLLESEPSDGISIFLERHDDIMPLVETEEIEDFCHNTSLSDLVEGVGTAGYRRDAWLDDRCMSEEGTRGEFRKHDNPLTATGLLRSLGQRVRHTCVLLQ